MARPEDQRPYSVEGPDAAAIKRFNRGGSGDGSPQKAYSVAGADPAAMKRFNAAGSGPRSPIAGGRAARRVGGGMLQQGPKLTPNEQEFERNRQKTYARRDLVRGKEMAHEKDLYNIRFGDNKTAAQKSTSFGKGGAGAADGLDRRSELLKSINEMIGAGGTYADQYGTGKITTSDGRVVGGRFKRKLSDMNDNDLLSVQEELASNLGDKKTAAAGLAGAKKALETRAGLLKQIVSATPKEIQGENGLEKVVNPAWEKANTEYLSILDRLANGDKPAAGGKSGRNWGEFGDAEGVVPPAQRPAHVMETGPIGEQTTVPGAPAATGDQVYDKSGGGDAAVDLDNATTATPQQPTILPAKTSAAQNMANDFIFDQVLPSWMGAVETGYKTIGNMAGKHPLLKGIGKLGGRVIADAKSQQASVDEARARKRNALSSL